MALPLAIFALPRVQRLAINPTQTNVRVECFIDDDLVDRWRIVALAYCDRRMRFPIMPPTYNKALHPIVDNLVWLSGNRAKTMSHGYLLLFVQLDEGEIHTVFTDFGTHNRALFYVLKPNDFSYKIFMGVKRSCTLRSLINIAKRTKTFDIINNNCKHYCQSLIVWLRGRLPLNWAEAVSSNEPLANTLLPLEDSCYALTKKPGFDRIKRFVH